MKRAAETPQDAALWGDQDGPAQAGLTVRLARCMWTTWPVKRRDRRRLTYIMSQRRWRMRQDITLERLHAGVFPYSLVRHAPQHPPETWDGACIPSGCLTSRQRTNRLRKLRPRHLHRQRPRRAFPLGHRRPRRIRPPALPIIR